MTEDRAKRHAGFTMIELMMVISVIGTLAAIAIPAYSGYTIRTKVAEGLSLASAAKKNVEEGWYTQSFDGIGLAAAAYNGNPIAERSSKYVSSVTIDPVNARIVVTINGGSGTGLASIAGNTLHLSANVQNAIPTNASRGVLDWACSSAANSTASVRGLTNIAVGTLPAKYAPTECA